MPPTPVPIPPAPVPIPSAANASAVLPWIPPALAAFKAAANPPLPRRCPSPIS